MTSQEDFRLDEHYTLTEEDRDLIIRNSSDPLTKEDWNKSGLAPFKERVKKFLAPRQQRLCAFCRTRIEKGTYYYEIEHIVPKHLHTKWMFDPQNFCLSCRRCNAKKSDNETLTDPNCREYPQDGTGFNIIHPYHDKYSDHIELIEDLFYSGITEKGKKTIEICNLSRYELVLHRIELHNANAPKDTYVEILTWLSVYHDYVNDMESLISEIEEDITHFLFPVS